jgi:signal transduction histidine kinase
MWKTRITGASLGRTMGVMADGWEPASPVATGAARAAALFVTVLAIATVIGSEVTISRQHFEARPEIDLPGWALAICLIGIVVIVAAAWMRRLPLAAVGFAIATIGALLPIWSGWSWLPASLRVAAIAAAPLVIAGVVRVMTTTPSGRIVDIFVVAAVVVHLGGYNAFADHGCSRTCADVQPFAGELLSTRSAVLLSTVLTIGAAAVAVVVLLRDSTAPPSSTAAAIGATGIIGVAAVLRWSAFDEVGGPPELLLLVPLAAVTLVAATTCISGVRTWRTRTEVRRLVDRLSGAVPSLPDGADVDNVQFAMPDGRWIDADGEMVGDARSECLVINDDAGPAVRLISTGSTKATDVLAALTPATRLALRNAQLSAIAKARVVELQASRRRVVAAADEERQRIERDLHDGAQQRLVGVTLHLRAAMSRADAPAAAALARADATTRAALASLRGIAHGIFPSVLATEGLGAALAGLVGASEAPVTLHVTGDLHVETETAMAAYATVAAALDPRRQLAATSAVVSIVRRNGTMTITIDGLGVVSDDSNAPDLTELADRVGAAGGNLAVTSANGHTTFTAALPCAS